LLAIVIVVVVSAVVVVVVVVVVLATPAARRRSQYCCFTHFNPKGKGHARIRIGTSSTPQDKKKYFFY